MSRIQGGAASVCLLLTLACVLETLRWVVSACLLRRRRVSARAASPRRAAILAAAGVAPLCVWEYSGEAERAASAAVLTCLVLHLLCPPLERTLGVASAQLASVGKLELCVVACCMACMGELRRCTRLGHAAAVGCMLWRLRS